MAKLPRRKGEVLFTNLTRNLAEGESPDTEFIYVILDRVPSLRSQVYIHRDDIIEGNFDQYTKGVEVEFAPEEVPDEIFQEALNNGSPIRKYWGRDVVLVSTSLQPAAANINPDSENVTASESNDKQKLTVKPEPAVQPAKKSEVVKVVERMTVNSLNDEEGGVISISGSDYCFQIICRDANGKEVSDKVTLLTSLPVRLSGFASDKSSEVETKKTELEVPAEGLLLSIYSGSISDVSICFVHHAAPPVKKILSYGV